MSGVYWIPFLAVVLIGGIVRAHRAVVERLRERRQLGLVRGVARVPIAQAGEGRATCVVGTIVGELPLVAPFTGRRCVYWRLEVEEQVANAFESWRPCDNGESARPTFTIRDDSGLAIVDSAGAEIAIDRSAGMRVADITPAQRAAREWLERRRHAVGGILPKRYRYRESALTADDPVAVVGVGVHEPDPDGATAGAAERGYREGPPTVLRLGSVATHPLFITDSPDATSR